MSEVRSFLLPDLGEGLTDAEVVRWLVGVGDRVEVDQPVAEMSTAKAVVEVPTPFAGVVVALHGEAGDTIAVGAPVLSIDVADPAEAVAGVAQPASREAAPTRGRVEAAAEPVEAAGEPVEAAGGAGRQGASAAIQSAFEVLGSSPGDSPVGAPPGNSQAEEEAPSGAARAAAAEERPARSTAQVGAGGEAAAGSVAEAGATGTAAAPAGSGNLLVGYGTREGGVRRRRVILDAEGSAVSPSGAAGCASGVAPSRAASPGAAEPVEGLGAQRIPLRGPRRLTAERLGRSHAEVPAATAWLAAEAGRLLDLRALVAARHPEAHVTPLAVLLRLCVTALHRFPLLNARFDAERQEVVTSPSIHLGIATQTARGLVVPVIRDAGTRSLVDIATELARLSSAARDGSIEASLLTGSTFTVSNYGSFGVDGGIALINPPEAAILGVGAIRPRPWVVQGAVRATPVVELSLAFDHRVCDGAEAAGFLRLLGDLVECPELAVAEG
jgi:2-oxoisovalerate dehydrogenase E2 component (dihydrolipoyl transacylase)